MITYYEKYKAFKIDTAETSYVLGIVDDRYLGHLYYGKKIESDDISYLFRTKQMPYLPSNNARDKVMFMDSFFFEYPTHGVGDFRKDALRIKTVDGYSALELLFDHYEIIEGKPELVGLPATFASLEGRAYTLAITLKDEIAKVKVMLLYSIFEDSDALMRSTKITYYGEDALYIERAYSMSIEFENESYDLLTLNGAWGRERYMQRQPIGFGYQGVSSLRGTSSHQHHPFIGVLSKDATLDEGEVLGLNFVYSGNFSAEAVRSQFDSVRILMGINDEEFCWKLNSGEAFQTPEVVMVYSDKGLGKMTRTYHDLYRNHLIRSVYKDTVRPILINNWEATYFDFDTDKLISIAKEASKQGIEMLVMDDGWFGERNDDNKSLGDWNVNENKIKGGLKYLVDEVNKTGLKFGIWFEPEMVCPDSELYRKHPDWAIEIPGRKPSLSRNQLILDITRKEVRDYIVKSVCDILHSANIEYVKWDMNRAMCDMNSLSLEIERKGELAHRYALAVYEMQDRVLNEFPNLLLENCSSGGGRFDPGMLYYSPQIWCSDDTDAVERLAIQEGTALLYPLSTMGAHVSDCPNHTVGRVVPFETRGYVALAGTFGYELDITRISEAERKMIPNQCKMYHKYRDLITKGDYYRIASYAENNKFDAYITVSKGKSEALLTYIRILNSPNYHERILKIKGLDPKKKYKIYRFNIETGEEEKYLENEMTAESYTGNVLMNAGLLIENLWGDFQGFLLHFTEEK